jgi:hypothetical protein
MNIRAAKAELRLREILHLTAAATAAESNQDLM